MKELKEKLEKRGEFNPKARKLRLLKRNKKTLENCVRFSVDI
jgi:hypothetical protein